MQIRIFISLYASLQCHIILQKAFQYVNFLSMLLFLAFYSSKNPQQNVTQAPKNIKQQNYITINYKTIIL